MPFIRTSVAHHNGALPMLDLTFLALSFCSFAAMATYAALVAKL
jgi:hypothetical protein